jgi:uncharacterized protein (TIGR00251 family)
MLYRWQGDDLLLSVRTIPRASRDQIGEIIGERLKIHITAPPVDGKANAHLLKFVASQFDVPASQIKIERGQTQRDKLLRIHAPRLLPPTLTTPDKI